MKISLKEWRGDLVTRAVRLAVDRKLRRVAGEILNQARELTEPSGGEEPGPPFEPPTGREGGLMRDYFVQRVAPMKYQVAGGLRALWTELGTGIRRYAPSANADFAIHHVGGDWIYPRRARVLHFFDWQGGEWYLESVAGAFPRPVLRSSVASAMTKINEILSEEVKL